MIRVLPTVAAALLLGACTKPAPAEKLGPPPEPVDASQPGPYVIGSTTLSLVDDRRAEPLVVEVWYPALDPGTEPDFYPEIAVRSGAHRDAEPDRRGAPYPVVAFSHGFGGIRYQSAFLTEYLASHGYIVVAADHRFTTMRDFTPEKFGEALVDRPGDVTRAMDGALADPVVGDLMDGSQFLMTGHSFGGLTTLMVSGAKLDIDHALAWCETDDPAGCDFFDENAPLPDATRAQPDPRAVAGVDISPAGWYAFGDAGLKDLPPMMAIAGTRDGDLPYETEAVPLMERLPAPAHLVTLEAAGHFTPTDLCVILSFYEECLEDEGFMAPERAHDVINTLVTAYASRHLLHSDLNERWLVPGAWRAKDVTLEVR